jgi:DNA primase
MLIPNYIVQKINAIDIISLAERLGINIVRNWKALCFMHDDHNASFTFYQKKQFMVLLCMWSWRNLYRLGKQIL